MCCLCLYVLTFLYEPQADNYKHHQRRTRPLALRAGFHTCDSCKAAVTVTVTTTTIITITITITSITSTMITITINYSY